MKGLADMPRFTECPEARDYMARDARHDPGRVFYIAPSENLLLFHFLEPLDPTFSNNRWHSKSNPVYAHDPHYRLASGGIRHGRTAILKREAAKARAEGKTVRSWPSWHEDKLIPAECQLFGHPAMTVGHAFNPPSSRPPPYSDIRYILHSRIFYCLLGSPPRWHRIRKGD
jgi:hypothetical protein